MTSHENLFSVLGLTETCTNEEVKAAYFKLAKQWHPDVNSNPMSSNKFKAISCAYEVLKSDQTRSEYIVKLYQKKYESNQTSAWTGSSSDTGHETHYANQWNAPRKLWFSQCFQSYAPCDLRLVVFCCTPRSTI